MNIAAVLACVAGGVLCSSVALATPPDNAPHVLLSFEDGANGELKATIKVTGMAGWESLHFAPIVEGSPGGFPGGAGFTDDDPANDWTFTPNTIELPPTKNNQTDTVTFTLLYDKAKVKGLTGSAHALRFFPDDQGTYYDPAYPGTLNAPTSGFSKYDFTSVSAIPEPSSWLLMLAGLGALTSVVRRRRRGWA